MKWRFVNCHQFGMKLRKLLFSGIFLVCYNALQAHRPFSQTSTDPASNLYFLLFMVAAVVLFFAPIITIIIGFISRKACKPWFAVPFAITTFFGVYHMVTGAIDFATHGQVPGSFYVGSVYVGIALIALLAYLRKNGKQD